MLYSDFIEILYKTAATAGLIAGGAWAFWKFVIQRESIWNLEITVVPEWIQHAPGLALLVVKVNLKNIGKVKIVPGSRGCEVSIGKPPPGIKANTPVDWGKCETVIENSNILRNYLDDDKHMFYVIEPGCAYHELECVAIQNGATYLIKTEFWWEKNADSITEYALINVP